MNWFVVAGIWFSIALANASLIANPTPTFVNPHSNVQIERVEEKPKPQVKPAPEPVEQLPAPVLASNNILRLLNQVRAKNGVPPLLERSDLNGTASLSVNNMIRKKSCCEHGNWEQWFVGTSYGWRGENIAACQVSDAEVVEAWVSSPPHFANIISTDFHYFGISVKVGTFVGEFSGGEPMQCKYYANHFGG